MCRCPSQRFFQPQILSQGLLVLLMLAGCSTAADDGITIEAAWIEMPDGVRLAADLYKPADLKPGDKVKVVVLRGEKEVTVEVKLGKSTRRGADDDG